MIINSNTRIGAIIKHKPEALELIVSIRPTFEKLRNPLLRKVIAARTTIAMASKLGGCSVEDFYNKLRPLGFEIDGSDSGEEAGSFPEEGEIVAISGKGSSVQPGNPVRTQDMRSNAIAQTNSSPMPDFLPGLAENQVSELDVRAIIQSGKDPLKQILDKERALTPGQVLKIVNSFEPVPLILMLEKKGYSSYVDTVGPERVDTYFFKKDSSVQSPGLQNKNEADPSSSNPEGGANIEPGQVHRDPGQKDWSSVEAMFEGRITTIDVRELEMPLPMHTILQALDDLDASKALFVYHKRIPVFLLPELTDRGFDYRIREISEGNVHLLIYKK